MKYNKSVLGKVLKK